MSEENSINFFNRMIKAEKKIQDRQKAPWAPTLFTIAGFMTGPLVLLYNEMSDDENNFSPFSKFMLAAVCSYIMAFAGMALGNSYLEMEIDDKVKSNLKSLSIAQIENLILKFHENKQLNCSDVTQMAQTLKRALERYANGETPEAALSVSNNK